MRSNFWCDIVARVHATAIYCSIIIQVLFKYAFLLRVCAHEAEEYNSIFKVTYNR